MNRPLSLRAGSTALVAETGVITAVSSVGDSALPDDALRVDAADAIVAPGLIDLQINGGFGHDFTDDPRSIWDVGARLVEHGVTAFLPTIVTSAQGARDAARRAISARPPDYSGALPLGLHFEGPFLNPLMSGAHDRALLRVPADADGDVDDWSPANGVRMVTLAPELPGALDMTRELTARGVLVSAGHSAATYEQAAAGFRAGSRYVTHLFNAMTALDKREPGLVGAALDSSDVLVGLIVDGQHLHPAIVRVVAAAATHERVSLVTDATAALGMPPGDFLLGGRQVVLDGRAVRDVDGRLAGSALAADAALRNFRSATRWPAEDVLATMTTVPAQLLGLHDRGLIDVGRRADLTLWTPQLELIATVIAGELVHGRWP